MAVGQIFYSLGLSQLESVDSELESANSTTDFIPDSPKIGTWVQAFMIMAAVLQNDQNVYNQPPLLLK